MKVGDIISFKASDKRPKKGEPTPVFVAVLLGVDELENPKLDPGEALRRLGWTPPESPDG